MPRPSVPILSRPKVARQALAMVEANGLDRFSVEGLARELGVRPSSLYHHFRDRDDILEEILQVALSEVSIPRAPADGQIEEWVVELAVRIRRQVFRYPNAAPLLATHSPRHLLSASFERCLQVFNVSGVPDELHVTILDGLEAIVIGSALCSSARSRVSDGPFDAVDADELPLLARAVERNPFSQSEVFDQMVRGFIRGVLAQAER